jgi:hypothetical protein
LISNLPGFSAEQLRILPDGGVVVADVEMVVRLNNSGGVVQTYDLAGPQEWTNVAIDVGGGAFWATSRETAYKFDLASGALLSSFQSSDYVFGAITVVGEPRAGVGPAGIPIPTMPTLSLVAMILTIAAVAVTRLNGGTH